MISAIFLESKLARPRACSINLIWKFNFAIVVVQGYLRTKLYSLCRRGKKNQSKRDGNLECVKSIVIGGWGCGSLGVMFVRKNSSGVNEFTVLGYPKSEAPTIREISHNSLQKRLELVSYGFSFTAWWCLARSDDALFVFVWNLQGR